jgi:uncharacterized protein (DUF2141 family)
MTAMFAFMAATLSYAEDETKMSTVTLDIQNVASTVGSFYIAVYNSKATFLGEERLVGKVVPVAEVTTAGVASVDIDVPFGELAIVIHHDDNDNKKMDANFIGIPKEPVAMSNQHVPRFGPPKYKKAKILIDQPVMKHSFTLD